MRNYKPGIYFSLWYPHLDWSWVFEKHFIAIGLGHRDLFIRWKEKGSTT